MQEEKNMDNPKGKKNSHDSKFDHLDMDMADAASK